MNLAGKLKGMSLGVGGVQVTITNADNPLAITDACLSGRYKLTTPCALTVSCVVARLVRNERTEDDYGFESIVTTTVAEFRDEASGEGNFPLQLVPGEPRERTFRLADIDTPVSSPNVWYLIEVSAQVRGMTSNPSDRRPIEVVAAKS